MFEILTNIFKLIKINTKVLGSLITIIFSSIIIVTWGNCCKFVSDFIMLIQKYSICLISFFKLYELFLAFICANNIGSLVNSLLWVKIFNPISVVFLFRGFNFILSAIGSSGSNFTSSSSSNDGLSGKSPSSSSPLKSSLFPEFHYLAHLFLVSQ